MTPLDTAIAAAKSDPEREAAFINMFLNSTVFVPCFDERPEGAHVAEGGETYRPAIINVHDAPTLFIFDTQERLAAFTANTDDVKSHIGIVCHALLASMTPSVHLVLNPGTEHAHEFPPEQIAILKGYLTGS